MTARRTLQTAVQFVALLGLVWLSACAPEKTSTQENAGNGPTIALLYDIGGKFDSSFNQAAYSGAARWAQETGGVYRDFEPTSETQFEQALRRFARRGTDLIIAVGIAYRVAVEKVALDFPDTQFMVVDSVIDLPNVRSVTFEEAEGSFLVGVLAAMKTESNKVGFVGGMDIPLIRRFSQGFQEGVAYVNSDISVVENYVGTTPTAWNDPIRAGELARNQYGRGVDIIFHAAGPSGLGVIQAAKDVKELAIGVDSNQNGVAPGFVLSSMLKRVDVAVYQAITDMIDGNWSTGQHVLGLAQGGVDYAVDEYNAALISDADKTLLESVKAKIIAGDILVAGKVAAPKADTQTVPAMPKPQSEGVQTDGAQPN